VEHTVASNFDRDIENLEISEFEKNGLQVYRNHTKSLTEQRQREFVAYINTKQFDPAPLERILQKILQEDARFLPVIACAFADEELKGLFAEAIRPGVPGGKSAMLGPYGPLSTFFNRIQLGYAFDLINADILEDLDLLRNARNRIAHEWDIRALSDFCDTKHIQKIIEFDMTPLLSGFGYSVSAKTNPAVALRLRLIWLLSRLVGECRYYFRAKQLGLDPQHLLLKGPSMNCQVMSTKLAVSYTVKLTEELK
jgi:hypothetical protein